MTKYRIWSHEGEFGEPYFTLEREGEPVLNLHANPPITKQFRDALEAEMYAEDAERMARAPVLMKTFDVE